jgi:hypothetical protein
MAEVAKDSDLVYSNCVIATTNKKKAINKKKTTSLQKWQVIIIQK